MQGLGWPRPLTTSATPHSQVDQQPADEAHLAALLEQARTWPGVEEAPSSISVPGARALVVTDGAPTGPPEAFLINREFCHGHAQGDYSLHLTLPPTLALEAEQAGWVESHFLALASRLPPTVVMLYAPRDANEVTVALELVRASFTFASGATAPTPSWLQSRKTDPDDRVQDDE